MNFGLICDVIGAVLILKSIFSTKILRYTVKFPNTPTKSAKELEDLLNNTKGIEIKIENESDKWLNDIKDIMITASNILKDRKFATIGIVFLVVGFVFQIIANTVIFYNF